MTKTFFLAFLFEPSFSLPVLACPTPRPRPPACHKNCVCLLRRTAISFATRSPVADGVSGSVTTGLQKCQ